MFTLWEGRGDWTHMLAGFICFNKRDWRDWKGSFGLNDTRAQQEAPWLWSWLTFPPMLPFLFQVPCSPTLHWGRWKLCWGWLSCQSKCCDLNVAVMGGVICYLSEQRQTTGIGLTIIPVNHAHVMWFVCQSLFCFQHKLVHHALSNEYAFGSFSHQSLCIWFQKQQDALIWRPFL